MKNLINYVSPFRIAGVIVILLAGWLFFYAGGSQLGGGVLLIAGIIFFTLDVFMNAMFKNSKASCYLIQLVIIALIVGWYLL